MQNLQHLFPARGGDSNTLRCDLLSEHLKVGFQKALFFFALEGLAEIESHHLVEPVLIEFLDSLLRRASLLSE